MNEFESLNVSDETIDALNKANILVPTPIQAESIPVLLNGEDLIGGAQTGTGKTFAYSIPLIERIAKEGRFVKALVLCPTRELSLQVKAEMDKLLVNYRLSSAAIYGGESYVIQNRKLKANPDIIIGTPGRIIDQMNKGNLDFSHVSYLVLDEADEMLKMGFEEDLETILKTIPEERQTALFSATLPPFIKKVAKRYMKEPKSIQIEAKTLTVEAIDQQVYYCKKDSKRNLVVRLLDFYEFKHIMIFCNTKAMVDELLVYLQNEGYKVEGLHGDLKQALRDRVMQQFRSNSVNILLCTDVAARGIDIDDIDCVINYDIPNENELYVHRIGRTARAGRSGTSITLSTSRGAARIRDLEKFTNSKMTEHEIPTVEKLKENYQKKLYMTIKEAIEANTDNTEFDKMIMKFSRESSDPIPVIRGLIALASKDGIKDYPEIETFRRGRDSSSKSKGKKDLGKKESARGKDGRLKKESSRGSKFVVIECNLGEADKVKPNLLVNTLHDELKIHREHFGKIETNKTRTFFEVNGEALRFFETKKKVKLAGKTLSFRLVDKKMR
ncbi:MAG: DEAD/DEAH box helicase [Acholeplasmatales bacterium]|nr:DEAD/DEAH box helicase [Acholeplasmatales bacterium]